MIKHIHFKTIDSTNTYLIKHYQDLDHLTVVSADHQTHGMGRLSRTWYGNEESILCSILLKEQLQDIPLTLLPLLAAKSLHQVLSQYALDIKIKWPNDLLIKGKKISGILVKSVTQDHHVLAVVIGIGININQDHFDEPIQKIATSLYLETKQKHNKEAIFNKLIDQLEHDITSLSIDQRSIISYCNTYSAITHQEVTFTYQGKTLQGTVEKINDEGYLVIHAQNQTYTINTGEITMYPPFV